MGEMADLWDKFFGGKVSPDPAVNLKWIENEQLRLLLKEAHDKMDDLNASEYGNGFCEWCKGYSYTGEGLDHDDDCILVKIRKVINV